MLHWSEVISRTSVVTHCYPNIIALKSSVVGTLVRFSPFRWHNLGVPGAGIAGASPFSIEVARLFHAVRWCSWIRIGENPPAVAYVMLGRLLVC